ncbi:hypothetical protein MKX03_012770 [Papaver bracteatum]|nr:hypothetical protein MKX03_012770 [Papaver bracteatum]
MEDEVEGGVGGERSSFVISLIENRAKEVGVAAFDLRSASLHLSQYIETSSSYQNTKTLLHFYDAMVIIVPSNKFAHDGMIWVSELVDKFYSTTKKVVMARGCFDDTKGALLVKSLAAKEPSALGLDTYYKQYYLCLAALAATVKWIEAEKGVIVTNHSLMVTFNGSFDHVNIDATSVQNLEIIEPLNLSLWGTSNKKRSVFHMLKTTRTIGGTRLHRANLLQPLKDIETINARLDCLDELMSNEELFFGLTQVHRKFPKETDRVLCHFCFKPKKITNQVLSYDTSKKSQVLISSIILLKTALEALPLLPKVLKDAKSSVLGNIYKSICENGKYASIRKSICDVIDENVLHARVPFVARTQQCFAVKAGIDGLLDVARQSFCDTSEAIHNLANKYREDLHLPNLKIPFSNRQGFYFSIPRRDINGNLPGKFIQVLKHGNNIHCSTLELASLNVRNKSAAAECYVRTELCLEECEKIEKLDTGKPCSLVKGLVDAIRKDVSVLTLLAEVLCLLDILVNSFAHTISTKPQICLIVILAQIGCYVPARFASLRVVDRIFTRMGTWDSLECNSSTFMTEMRETSFVMQNVSPRSLIVMDELGRATSSADGFAIAWSCCEHLVSLKAYTIFATHMENLSELSTIYPNVEILHFDVDVKNNLLDFKDGIRHVPHYGLLLAGIAGLPSSVTETARSITSKLTEMLSMEYNSIQMVYRIAQRLVCLKYSNQDEDSP